MPTAAFSKVPRNRPSFSRSASSARSRSAISRSSSRGVRMARACGVAGTRAMTVLTDAIAVANLIRPASRYEGQ